MRGARRAHLLRNRRDTANTAMLIILPLLLLKPKAPPPLHAHALRSAASIHRTFPTSNATHIHTQGDLAETQADQDVFGSHAKKVRSAPPRERPGTCLARLGPSKWLYAPRPSCARPPTINLENADPECD